VAAPDYQLIGRSAGFEIGRRGDEVLLAHRATRGPALVAWIVGGLAAFAAGHAVLWPCLGLAGRVAMKPAAIAGAALTAGAVLLFAIARTGYRSYRRRRDAPVDETPGYRADLAAGALLAGDERVAALADVTVDTPRNLGDSTQGSMRWIRLRWPGGKALVYSAAAKDAQRVAAALVELGVGRPG